MQPTSISEIERRRDAVTIPTPWRWGDWQAEFGEEESPDLEERKTLEHCPYLDPDRPGIRLREHTSTEVLTVEDELSPEIKAFLQHSASDIDFLLSEVKRLRGELHVESVQPDWCLDLTYQQQSVLFIAARGPDGVPKSNRCKAVTKAFRACVLKSARRGRLLEWGEKCDTFHSLDRFSDDALWAEDVTNFFEDVDGLPHHAYQHLMLGAEILGYKHPDRRFKGRWYHFYRMCVDNLHLNEETEAQMDARLSDWSRMHWNEKATDNLCEHGFAQDMACDDCGRPGFRWQGVNDGTEQERLEDFMERL